VGKGDVRAGVTRAVLAGAIAAALGAGCSGERNRILRPPGSDIPPLTVAQLLQAPDTLRVDGATLTAQVSLWRDFMNQPANGSLLYASVHLNGAPPDTIPPTAGKVYLWVIHGSDVWSATLALGPTDPDGTRIYSASGGPRWGPGIDVDVVIGVRTSPSDVALVLRRNVPILMTL
jgi:hypothetical protein